MGLTFKTEIVFRFCASRSQSPCLFGGGGGDLEWKGASLKPNYFKIFAPV